VFNCKEPGYIEILANDVPTFTLTSSSQAAALGFRLALRIALKLQVVNRTTAKVFLKNFPRGFHRAIEERPKNTPLLNLGNTNEANYQLTTEEIRNVDTFASATAGRVRLSTNEEVEAFAEVFGYEVMSRMEHMPSGFINTFQHVQIFYAKFLDEGRHQVECRDQTERVEDLGTEMDYTELPQPHIDDERPGFNAVTITADKFPFGRMTPTGAPQPSTKAAPFAVYKDPPNTTDGNNPSNTESWQEVAEPADDSPKAAKNASEPVKFKFNKDQHKSFNGNKNVLAGDGAANKGGPSMLGKAGPSSTSKPTFEGTGKDGRSAGTSPKRHYGQSVSEYTSPPRSTSSLALGGRGRDRGRGGVSDQSPGRAPFATTPTGGNRQPLLPKYQSPKPPVQDEHDENDESGE